MKRIWFALACPWFMLPATAAQKPIKVLTEHLPPYQINTPAGPQGFATDVVKATFAEAGIGYQIEFQSWSRAYQRALKQANTCIYSISRSDERLKLFQWVGAISYNTTALYKLSQRKDINVKTLEDAKRYRLAVTRDDITHLYLLSRGFQEGVHLYLPETTDSMLNLLVNRSNEIDLVLVNETILRYRLQESGLDPRLFVKLIDLPELPLDFHLACSLNTSPELVQNLRAALVQLKQDGRFKSIVGNWSERME